MVLAFSLCTKYNLTLRIGCQASYSWSYFVPLNLQDNCNFFYWLDVVSEQMSGIMAALSSEWCLQYFLVEFLYNLKSKGFYVHYVVGWNDDFIPIWVICHNRLKSCLMMNQATTWLLFWMMPHQDYFSLDTIHCQAMSLQELSWLFYLEMSETWTWFLLHSEYILYFWIVVLSQGRQSTWLFNKSTAQSTDPF